MSGRSAALCSTRRCSTFWTPRPNRLPKKGRKRHKEGRAVPGFFAPWSALVQLLESRLEFRRHARMPETFCGGDARVECLLRLIYAIEFLEREGEPPESVALIVIRREIRAQLFDGLRVQPLLERLVREAESREHVVRMLRDHRAERLEPRAQRATRSAMRSATRCGATSGTKWRTSGITSRVEPEISACSLSATLMP